jgi:hypothetical protein
MYILRETNRFLFGFLTPAHVEETVRVACGVLARSEPMIKVLGISAAELRPYVKACVIVSCDEELGVIAIDRWSGRVVGFSLAKDCLSSLQVQVPGKLLPMQEVTSTLLRWYLRDSPPRWFGVLGHELMMGVACEQLDLEQELMAVSTALLRARGFQRSIAMATGPRSQQLYAALGASRVHSIGYRQFISTRDQQRPFIALSGQACVLMAKELQLEAVRHFLEGCTVQPEKRMLKAA